MCGAAFFQVGALGVFAAAEESQIVGLVDRPIFNAAFGGKIGHARACALLLFSLAKNAAFRRAPEFWPTKGIPTFQPLSSSIARPKRQGLKLFFRLKNIFANRENLQLRESVYLSKARPAKADSLFRVNPAGDTQTHTQKFAMCIFRHLFSSDEVCAALGQLGGCRDN